jgi:predicted AAA+ superfamily ATPase
MEGESEYSTRLKQTINHVLESDLPNAERIDFYAVHHLRKLFSILAELVPYKPNIVKLSSQVGVSRETLIKYLHLLDKAELVMLLRSNTTGISKMNKPEKIYLNNPNLIYVLASVPPNPGTIRETFFYNQLRTDHIIESSDIADFFVNRKYTMEIRGKSKTRKQIAGVKNAFIAADNIEYSQKNKIPLWLFGFLY